MNFRRINERAWLRGLLHLFGMMKGAMAVSGQLVTFIEPGVPRSIQIRKLRTDVILQGSFDLLVYTKTQSGAAKRAKMGLN